MSGAVSKPSDVLQDELTVSVRGVDYVFRLPSIRYDIEVAGRASSIRRAADPASGGQIYGIGERAARLSFALAIMELYLKAGPEWPFSAGPGGKPVVNHEKFPRDKTATVYEIGGAFEEAYARFCDDGTADVNRASAEALAGQ
jgi:hypothetical protein